MFMELPTQTTQPCKHDWESVVITYAGHPLCGLSLQVVRRVRTLGTRALVVPFPNGQRAAIPIAWAELRPSSPVLQVKGKAVRLHPGSLRELSELVSTLLSAQADVATKLDRPVAPPPPSSASRARHCCWCALTSAPRTLQIRVCPGPLRRSPLAGCRLS